MKQLKLIKKERDHDSRSWQIVEGIGGTINSEKNNGTI